MKKLLIALLLCWCSVAIAADVTVHKLGSVVSGAKNVTIIAEDNSTTLTFDNVNVEFESTDGTQRTFKITSNKAGNTTVTLYENFTIGDGYDGTLTFTASGKTLSVGADSTIDQNLSSGSTVRWAGINSTTTVTASGNISAATYGSDSSISNAELLTLDDGATTEILVGGGAGVAPVWTTATGTGAPVRANGLSVRNGLTVYHTSEAVADDASIVLATGVSGWGTVQAGDNEQFIQFTFTSAGIVTVITNTANAINSDTDNNLCVYDVGSGIAIKNRLGALKTIRAVIYYSS